MLLSFLFNTEDNINGSNEKSSGSSYFTSACMKNFQEDFNYNCDDLIILRWFRDKFVSIEDIDHRVMILTKYK